MEPLAATAATATGPAAAEAPEVTLMALGHATDSTTEAPTVAETPPGFSLGLPGRDRPDRFPVDGWERYTFVELIGSGGMGRVYKAFDPRLKRYVALKFVHRSDPDHSRRFLAEAQSQARVEHENVGQVYEAGEVEGKLYIAMELFEGRTLKQCHGEMSLAEKVEVVAQVAEGLAAAHRIGLVHRDVKPSNIMVERRADGGYHPYLMDFGIAREMAAPGMTATGLVVGTPAYLSPEQAAGEPEVDHRTDVYSLGATLYELFAGRPPFDGESSLKVLMRVVTEEPLPLRNASRDLPPALEAIVMKCLAKEPARRYASALELARDLRRFLAGEPVSARPATVTTRVVKQARKHPFALACAAAALIATTSLAALWLEARGAVGAEALRSQSLERQVESLCTLLAETGAEAPAGPTLCGAGAPRTAPAAGTEPAAGGGTAAAATALAALGKVQPPPAVGTF